MKKFKANDLLEMETPGGKVTARVITALDRNCKVATADGAFIVLSYKDLKGMKAKLVTETPADPPAADTGETLADGKVILFRMAGGEILTKTPKGFYLEPADFSFTERVNQAAALRLIRDGEIVIEREATLTTFYVLPAAGPVPTPAAASVETAAELVERLAGELDALAEVNSYPIAVRSNRCDPPQMLFIDRETLDIDSAFDVKTVNEISRGRLVVETHKIGQRLLDAKNAKSLSGLAILKSLIEG